MPRYHQGIYKPKNPSKYVGDPNNIIYRSGWELSCMRFFDRNASILKWASEELVIPYIDHTGKRRRYFPDFLIRTKQADGTEKIVMIEVKPSKETRPPKKPKRQTKRYIEEVHTYGTNMKKWEYAKAYCQSKGWDFQVWTEESMKFV